MWLELHAPNRTRTKKKQQNRKGEQNHKKGRQGALEMRRKEENRGAAHAVSVPVPK